MTLKARLAAIPRFGPIQAAAPGLRVHEIDGVRGWAALAVVNYHLFWTLLEFTVPWMRNPVTGS